MNELEQELNVTEYKQLKRKYLNLIKNIHEFIVEFKLDGRIVFASPQSYQVLGLLPENLIDTNLFSLIPPEDWEIISKMLQKILKSDTTEQIELKVRHDNGKNVKASFKVSLLKTDRGISFIGIMSDVVGNLKAEISLKDPGFLYKNLIESVKTPILILNRDGILELVNYETAAFLGGKPEDFVGKSIKDLFPNDFYEEYYARNEKVFVSGKDNTYEYTFNLPVGSKTFIVNQHPVKDIDGKVIANQIIATDITDKKEAENKLKKSEEQYKVVFDNMLNAFALHEVIYDEKGNPIDYRFLQVNPAFMELTGLQDPTGKTVREVIPNVEQFWINTYNDVVVTGESKTFEQYSEPLNKWYRVTAFKVKKGQFVCEFIDITLRKKSEEKLKKNEQQLSGIISSITDHMSIIDREYSIIWTNNVAKKWFGDKLVGKRCYQAYHQKDSPCDHCNAMQTFDDGKIHEHESHVVRVDGSKVDLWCITSVVETDESGQPSLVIQISRDITKRKRVERELIEISNLKSQLLSRTSHELKTPLIAIKGFSSMLLELHSHKLDSDMTSILTEIKDGCVRMQETINKLSFTSTLESETIKLNTTEEDLSFLIKFCVNELRGVVREREQSINLGIHDEIMVNIEKEKIHEVVSHLIINAIKNTPPKGMIKISTELNDDICVISVEDNGIGITEEEKKRLFKQFGKIERYGMGWDIGIDGTGVGLYISRKIVELHGGKIWAESSGRNKGATFSFSLPLLKQ